MTSPVSAVQVLVVALLLALVGGSAVADERVQILPVSPQSFSYTFPDRIVGFSRTDTDVRTINFIFDKHNPEDGELTAVRVMIATSTGATFSGTILASSIAGCNANMNVAHCLNAPGLPGGLCLGRFFNQSGTFTPQQQTLTFTFGGPQGGEAGPVTLSASALPLYQGPGTVTIPLRLEFVQEATVSNTGMTYRFGASVQPTVTLIYEFTPPAPPCPADWNGDGAVDSADISGFITSWLASIAAGELAADFNGDGAVNSGDISAFLTAWIAAVGGGC